MMTILVQTGLKKVVTGKKPENLGYCRSIDGENLIRLVERVRNSLCD
ncbi:hypothetical protein Godav_004530 [Gossypium davidsonii]|uniref:Uncharacterized protein n=1 Tax=Gossypium davidsonii TaxID=34287 RepID=A0A7J8SMY9_GOSDV|nr:hypothetical protein [Gossypium davidsonii]